MNKIIILFLCILVSGCAQQASEQVQDGYSPTINPADFSSAVTNKYFTLLTGTNMIYEGQTEDGLERIEVRVLNETKTVMGVKAVVVWDRVWLNGELIEDTKDLYAQDKEGNVWYFGEKSMELAGGKVVSYAGSWEYGVDGALPGIIMKANPKAGDSYRQEYYKGEAEDMADVVAVGESVTVPYRNFTNCLKTRDYTPLEPGADEYKYYCPQAGGVALEVVAEDGERVELIDIKYESDTKVEFQKEPEGLVTNITEAQAKQIAIKQFPGIPTDVAIETKYGKLAYVVEIDPPSGRETDVIVDAQTGQILGME